LLRIPKINDTKINLLAINHYFDQDIKALQLAASNDINITIVEVNKIFGHLYTLYPQNVRLAKIPYDDDRIKTYRHISYLCSFIIIILLLKKVKIDCIITPSDSFYWLREFIAASKKLMIPTIVLDKEGIISPFYFNNYPQDIKKLFPFFSDRIVVWSERQKEFWMKSGVPLEKIKVIGQPRSDLLFKLKKETNFIFNNNNPLVLFFTFEINAYIPTEYFKDKKVSWEKLRNDIHSVLKKIARNHSDLNFVVKCHPQQLDKADIEQEFNGYQNVKVLSGASLANQLLINADLVIGFQTTSLIESILLRKPTIYTHWTTDYDNFRDGVIPFHEHNAFIQANSPEELEKQILNLKDKKFVFKVDLKDRDILLKEYLNNPDGNVSNKILKYINTYLNNPLCGIKT